jgi:hypothetical protein
MRVKPEGVSGARGGVAGLKARAPAVTTAIRGIQVKDASFISVSASSGVTPV